MPLRSLAVILNPAAGNRRAGRARARLLAALEASNARYELLATERPHHAEELARAAAASFDAVIAAGGDGTLQEVATGLWGSEVALGVLPLGTGNDFAGALGIPKHPAAAVEALLRAEVVPVDGGRVRWRNEGETTYAEAVFVNAVGVGFDALAAAEAASYKWFRGLSGYLVAVLKALRIWTHPDLAVRHIGEAVPVGREGVEAEGEMLYRGPFFLAAVSNGVTVGGGFRLTPDAQVDDSLLDLCLVAGPLSTPRVFQLLPKAITGRHLGEPEVTSRRVRSLSLEISAGVPIHVDGEILTRKAVEVLVEVLPGAFQMLRPMREAATFPSPPRG